jgi:hypothetical protein
MWYNDLNVERSREHARHRPEGDSIEDFTPTDPRWSGMIAEAAQDLLRQMQEATTIRQREKAIRLLAVVSALVDSIDWADRKR